MLADLTLLDYGIVALLIAGILAVLLVPQAIKPDEQAKLDWEARTRKRLQDDHK